MLLRVRQKEGPAGVDVGAICCTSRLITAVQLEKGWNTWCGEGFTQKQMEKGIVGE